MPDDVIKDAIRLAFLSPLDSDVATSVGGNL